MIMSRLGNELFRKAIHLIALIIPISYSFYGKHFTLILVGTGLTVAVVVEILKKGSQRFFRKFESLFSHLLRAHELTGITGATYLLLSSFICVLFFDQWIALVCLYFLLIADALGALVGRLWGRHYIFHHRSYEGCFVFLIACVVIIYVVPGVPLRLALPGVVVAFLIDVFVQGIDDNLTIPVGAGLFMQLMQIFFEN